MMVTICSSRIPIACLFIISASCPCTALNYQPQHDQQLTNAIALTSIALSDNENHFIENDSHQIWCLQKIYNENVFPSTISRSVGSKNFYAQHSNAVYDVLLSSHTPTFHRPNAKKKNMDYVWEILLETRCIHSSSCPDFWDVIFHFLSICIAQSTFWMNGKFVKTMGTKHATQLYYNYQN